MTKGKQRSNVNKLFVSPTVFISVPFGYTIPDPRISSLLFKYVVKENS